MIKAERMDEVVAGHAARAEKLLKVAGRDSGFRGDDRRAQFGIGQVCLDRAADSGEQLVCMGRYLLGGRCKKSCKEVIDNQLHLSFRQSVGGAVSSKSFDHELQEQAVGGSSAPVERAPRFKTQMRDQPSARQMKGHMSNAARSIEDSYRTRRIDERQISSIQFKQLVPMLYG